MFNSIKLLAAVGALTIVSDAGAASITYTGFQQVGTISANYSITTDGSTGIIGYMPVTDFSVNLTDASTSFTITPTNGRFEGFLNATANGLSVARAGSSFTAFAGNAYFILAPNLTTAQLSLEDGVVDLQRATAPNNIAFAFVAPVATPAVPEPAMWVTMIVGLGFIGATLRRGSKARMGVKFA